MSFIQMSVPLVFWGRRPPTHEITCICKSEDKRGIATASRSGQICLWEVYKDRDTEKVKVRPRCLMFGGKSPTISLCFIRDWSGERDRIASLSQRGTIALWDGKDGACLKYVFIPGRHSGIKSLSRSKFSETLIALYGQYSEIHILDSASLEVICTLKSSYNPNWNAEISFIHNVERRDALMSLTVDGVAKLWLLPSRNELKETEVIYEEKSKTLGIINPVSLSCFSYGGHSTALVVCKDNWQLFDATGGKMKLLMIHACESSVNAWMAGDYLDCKTIILWAKDDGRAYIYKLSSRCVPGIVGSLEESVDASSTAGCVVEQVMGVPNPPSSPMAVYVDRYWHLQGDVNGRLYLWDIRVVRGDLPWDTEKYSKPTLGEPVHPFASASIADSWEPPAMPCGLTDMLYKEDEPPTITCAIYLSSFGRLVCGQADGSIAVLSATQAASVLMLQPRKFSRGWPQYIIMKGHRGKVNVLFYPHSTSKAYNPDYLLSGGADFTVRLWDLYSGALIHTFAVHGGMVKDLIACPPEINPRLQTCVCSVGEDYSVAILSTSERKCLLVAACHSAPIETVRFRLEEDFLLVSCTDGKVYIWQIETGSLDRCVDGKTAQIIFGHSTDTTIAYKPLSNVPLQVRCVRADDGDSLIQVLLVDPQCLINRLAKMEKLEREPKKKEPKQIDPFRTYLYARKHFGAGGPSRPPKKASNGSLSRSLSLGGPPSVSLSASVKDSREHERAREVLGKAVASKEKTERLQEEAPIAIVNIVRLLLSCLHAWNLDDHLDEQCEETLGLVRPYRPVSFGLLSRGSGLSLVLPGWGLRSKRRIVPHPGFELDPIEENVVVQKPPDHVLDETSLPSHGSTSPRSVRKHLTRARSMETTFDQKYHVRWQLSRSLTTQHLLTMVSITNTLMNESIGAHELARSSGTRKRVSDSSFEDDSDDSGSEESQTIRDNIIRAVWSQVAALHCVMLPEHMEGKFYPPHLPVLAFRFLDPCQAIREASQALLQAELRRIGPQGRKFLVSQWSQKLPIPSSVVSTPEKKKPSAEETKEGSALEAAQQPATQQQQATAIVILGMIGAEFSDNSKSLRKTVVEKDGKKVSSPSDLEVMDPAIARHTAKTLQALLLEKPTSKTGLYSNLRCSAAELLGRGFNLWEKYVDIPQVVMGLLDLTVQYTPPAPGTEEEDKAKKSSTKTIKFVSEVARKALNLMILLRPVTMVTTLAKEVGMFIVSQHATHFIHSHLPTTQVGVTPPPSTAGIVTPGSHLLPLACEEVLALMRTVIEKCSQAVSLHLLEVIDVVTFCFSPEFLKKRSIMEVFPCLSRLPNVSYAAKSKRLAVGSSTGHVGIYDYKQGKLMLMLVHAHPVTALLFSDDGRLLATYAYGDSALSVWQLGSSLFGGMFSQDPRIVNSWPAISGSTFNPYMSFIRLEWAGSRSIILHMPGGVECKYSL